MAYIYLEELEEILPGILSDWIDGDDESWEWIFQEIEQKCHVGKKSKKKKKVSKIDAIEIAIMAHRNDINELNKKYDEIKFNDLKKIKEDISFLISRVRVISCDAKEAKFAAQTAKQRTEVDYSKYSGKSDGAISYCNSDDKDCRSCKHYCDTEAIKSPCIECNAYQYWEAKDE